MGGSRGVSLSVGRSRWRWAGPRGGSVPGAVRRKRPRHRRALAAPPAAAPSPGTKAAMAGYVPGLLPANRSQEKEFVQAYEDVLERYKGTAPAGARARAWIAPGPPRGAEPAPFPEPFPEPSPSISGVFSVFSPCFSVFSPCPGPERWERPRARSGWMLGGSSILGVRGVPAWGGQIRVSPAWGQRLSVPGVPCVGCPGS